jgi:hypothetical protein
MDATTSAKLIPVLLDEIERLKGSSIPASKPTLVYFPAAGRADTIRKIAAAAGLELEELTELPEGDSKENYGSPSKETHCILCTPF